MYDSTKAIIPFFLQKKIFVNLPFQKILSFCKLYLIQGRSNLHEEEQNIVCKKNWQQKLFLQVDKCNNMRTCSNGSFEGKEGKNLRNHS